MENKDWTFILFIALSAIAIFFILRELTCWYFKINKIVDGQEKTNKLLSEIKQVLNKES